MRRSNVDADKTVISEFGVCVDVAPFGEAEKKTRGRRRSAAVAIDKMDKILKERDFGVFVVMGWWDPLRAA